MQDQTATVITEVQNQITEYDKLRDAFKETNIGILTDLIDYAKLRGQVLKTTWDWEDSQWTAVANHMSGVIAYNNVISAVNGITQGNPITPNYEAYTVAELDLSAVSALASSLGGGNIKTGSAESTANPESSTVQITIVDKTDTGVKISKTAGTTLQRGSAT